MSKLRGKLTLVFLGLCLTTSAFAIEVTLKYKRHPDKPKSFHPRALVQLEKKIGHPTGKWKIPELISEYPIYAFINIGDRERLCILDRQKADDIFYNRFYFDTNGNSDLTDDPITDGFLNRSSKQSCNVGFPSVDTTIEVSGRSLPYSFRPYVYTSRLEQLSKKGYMERNIDRYVRFRFWVNCSYSGEFQVNGESYRVVLGDMNGNGLFNERFSLRRLDILPPGYRRIQISGEGDNLFITSSDKIDIFDGQVLGDLLLVKDKLFKVSVSTARGKLTLTPINKNLVALRLSTKTERISLYTEDGKYFLNVYKPEKKIMVPKGKYRLISYQLFRKDEQGDMWRLSAVGTTETPFFSVDGSGESVLEFGEPYTPISTIRELGMRSSRAYLMFNIEGKGKEYLTDVSHISGNQTLIPLSVRKGRSHHPKEPTYKIMKADGEVVSQGSFEYG